MINLRTSGIIAGVAFILSLLIGMISNASMPMLVLRPVIFAVLFFIISAFARFLVNHFLPELLEDGGLDDTPLPGSRINITEGDTSEFTPGNIQPFAKPPVMGAQADDSENGLGNISELMMRGPMSQASDGRVQAGSSPLETLDQDAQDGYNTGGEAEEFSGPESPSSLGPLSLEGTGVRTVGIPDSVDVLPDLDSMAGAFLPSSGEGVSDTTEYSVSTPSPKPSSGGKKAPAWAGDFNAKDMAAGLRTILSKEKEG